MPLTVIILSYSGHDMVKFQYTGICYATSRGSRAVKPRGGTAHSDSCIGTLPVHTLFWLSDVAMHLTAGVLQVWSL
jgi:hypothetical protein